MSLKNKPTKRKLVERRQSSFYLGWSGTLNDADQTWKLIQLLRAHDLLLTM